MDPGARNGLRPRAGFSLVEVMVTMVVAVVGLLAVASAATSTSLLRKRGQEETAAFAGMVSRLEWARGALFSATAFHEAALTAIAGGDPYVQSFVLDDDGDGVQDLPAGKNDAATPILTVRVSAADGQDPADVVRVDVTAAWYGIGGARTRSIDALVANRRGFGE